MNQLSKKQLKHVLIMYTHFTFSTCTCARVSHVLSPIDSKEPQNVPKRERQLHAKKECTNPPIKCS